MINILLYILVLVLPFCELLRFEIRPDIFIRVLDVLSLLFLIPIFLNKKKPINKAVLGFGIVLIISNLTNPPNLASLSYLIRTLLYLTIINYFLNSEFRVSKKLEFLFRLNLFIFLFVGFIQYFLYPNLRNLYYLGYDPHSYRLFALFLDPNITGIILVWSFIYFYNKQNKFKIVILSLVSISILLTYSRISWLCFIVSLITLNVNKSKKLALVLLATVFILGIFLLPRHFGEGTNIWRTNSLKGKISSVNLVSNAIKEKPILGIGFNNTHLIKNKGKLANNSLYGIDNSLLTTLVTSGIIGLFAYLWLFKELLKNTYLPIKAITLTYFIHSLSVNSFYIPSVIWYFLLFQIIQYKKP